MGGKRWGEGGIMWEKMEKGRRRCEKVGEGGRRWEKVREDGKG